jgi:hypothetical protein
MIQSAIENAIEPERISLIPRTASQFPLLLPSTDKICKSKLIIVNASSFASCNHVFLTKQAIVRSKLRAQFAAIPSGLAAIFYIFPSQGC